MPCPRSLANLARGQVRKGPSPLALAVLRRLLHIPMTIEQLEASTGFDKRRVRAQVEWLRDNGGAYTKRMIPPGRRAGPVAVYAARVILL